MLFYSPAPCPAATSSLPEASPIADLNFRNFPDSRGLVKYVFQANCSLFYLVSDIVIRRINVFCSKMIDRIAGHFYSRLIISQYDNWVCIRPFIIHLFQCLNQEGYFFDYITFVDVFSFSRWRTNALLMFEASANWFISYEKHIVKCEFSRIQAICMSRVSIFDKFDFFISFHFERFISKLQLSSFSQITNNLLDS